MLNNPPVKETKLFCTRENDKYSIKNSHSRPGEIGVFVKDA